MDAARVGQHERSRDTNRREHRRATLLRHGHDLRVVQLENVLEPCGCVTEAVHEVRSGRGRIAVRRLQVVLRTGARPHNQVNLVGPQAGVVERRSGGRKSEIRGRLIRVGDVRPCEAEIGQGLRRR